MKNRREANSDAIVLGGLIRHYRQLNNLSQLQLAVRADINSSYLSAVENGHNIISFMKLLKICTALELEPDKFIIQFLYVKDQYDNFLDTKDQGDSFVVLEKLRRKISVELPNLLKDENLFVAETEEEYNESGNISDTLELE